MYIEISENERKILEMLRDLRPFEEVKVTKDQGGRLDSYFVVRTQKVVLSDKKTK